jgi:hypothetical protein
VSFRGFRRLVQEFPSGRPIEVPHAYRCNGFGLEVSGVYAHPAVVLHLCGLPVRDAPARGATDKLEPLVAPGVTRDGSRLSADCNVLKLVIRPERAIAAANGTVAARELTRLSWNFKAHGAAVAGSGEHGCSW